MWLSVHRKTGPDWVYLSEKHRFRSSLDAGQVQSPSEKWNHQFHSEWQRLVPLILFSCVCMFCFTVCRRCFCRPQTQKVESFGRPSFTPLLRSVQHRFPFNLVKQIYPNNFTAWSAAAFIVNIKPLHVSPCSCRYRRSSPCCQVKSTCWTRQSCRRRRDWKICNHLPPVKTSAAVQKCQRQYQSFLMLTFGCVNVYFSIMWWGLTINEKCCCDAGVTTPSPAWRPLCC